MAVKRARAITGTTIGIEVLLLTFLVLASYYFHPFWKLDGIRRVNLPRLVM